MQCFIKDCKTSLSVLVYDANSEFSGRIFYAGNILSITMEDNRSEYIKLSIDFFDRYTYVVVKIDNLTIVNESKMSVLLRGDYNFVRCN